MFKNKRRKLTSAALAIAVGIALILPVGVWAAVNPVAGDFKIFLNDETKAKATLAAYAPREIDVEGPEKYIDSIEVIHKQAATLEDTSNSVSITNIDILMKDNTVTTVDSIDITVANQPTRNITPSTTSGGDQFFQLGVAGLGNGFDIKIEVLDSLGNVIETKNFIVPKGTDDIFRINKEFPYETAGVTFTLYELLDNPAKFTELLVEHKPHEIKMNNLQ